MFLNTKTKRFIKIEEARRLLENPKTEMLVKRFNHRAVWFDFDNRIGLSNFTSKPKSYLTINGFTHEFNNHKNMYLDKRYMNPVKLFDPSIKDYIILEDNLSYFLEYYKDSKQLLDYGKATYVGMAFDDFFSCLEASFIIDDNLASIIPGRDSDSLYNATDLKNIARGFKYNETDIKLKISQAYVEDREKVDILLEKIGILD